MEYLAFGAGIWMMLILLLIYLLPLEILVVLIRRLNKKNDKSVVKLVKIIIVISCCLLYPVGLLAFIIVHFTEKRIRNVSKKNNRNDSEVANNHVEWEMVIREDGSKFWQIKNPNYHKMSPEESEFYNSTYYQMTHKMYWDVVNDKGEYGEYLIWKELKWLEKKFEGMGRIKFLFNVYIPNGNGSTAEIDVILICPQGLFVFESKNFSGWIFGNENQKEWTQSLNGGYGTSEKHHFYNPVMQNKTHIECIRRVIRKNIPMWSVIAFSERYELMNVEIQSKDVFVVQRHKISALVDLHIDNRTTVLSDDDIEELYQLLYPMTQVNDEVKRQHNADVECCF